MMTSLPPLAVGPQRPAMIAGMPPASQVANTPVPPAVVKPPRLTLMEHIEEEFTDLLLLISKFQPARTLGYFIYGLMTKPKANALPLDNMGALSGTILRGAQPNGAGFDSLKAKGVDTVINLRPEANWEAAALKKAGMKEIYMPLPALGAPTNAQALEFLSAVTDPANGKVFFHCQHGADRTGEMAAAYRIAVQGWSGDRAVNEMYNYRFHTGFQYEKQLWVYDFAKFWQTVPAAKRAEILHSAPQAGQA